MDNNKNEIAAVIIAYNPNLNEITKVIHAVGRQVSKVFVVDNSPDCSQLVKSTLPEYVEVISLGFNSGVASGFNRGIGLAIERGYRYVLLLDQDSIIPEGMLDEYLRLYSDLRCCDVKISAIGPRYINQDSKHMSRFVRYGWFGNLYCCPKSNENYVLCDFLISSGTLYDTAVFSDIGMMNDGFFIDHVDTEWFMRAASKGYSACGSWNVIMNHKLGIGEFAVWFKRWRRQPIHKPFRLYYVFRNSLLMYRMGHVPLKWISGDVLRLLRIALIYLLFIDNRKLSAYWMMLGLYHGVRGVSGCAPAI